MLMLAGMRVCRPLSVFVSLFSFQDLALSSMESLMAGGLAGLCTDLSLYPLDTLKTRLQSAVGFQKAGGFHGVYTGLGSVVAGSIPSAALFWWTYDTAKSVGLDYRRRQASGPGESTIHMLSASCAEVSALIVRVPVDNVKQKMQAKMAKTIVDTCRTIVRTDGVQGFYIGTFGMLLRDLPFAMVQFPLYEQFKLTWSKWAGHKDVRGVTACLHAVVGNRLVLEPRGRTVRKVGYFGPVSPDGQARTAPATALQLPARLLQPLFNCPHGSCNRSSTACTAPAAALQPPAPLLQPLSS